jgi:hypothetical protein
MSGWTVTDPWIFFGIAGVVVGYLLYMMISRRKGDRPRSSGQEVEL